VVFNLERNDWERFVQNLIRERILRSPEIIRAFRKVPREKFIPENVKVHACVDTPLPIGHGQTISAPHNTVNAVLGETWLL
jgi:protein-L-isoaspartate(D-aspartate) O-methyltransferase